MAECTHDCSSCSADCGSRDLRVPGNAMSSVKRVIAVVSGKGGVGKSTITASLAVAMARKGRKVAVLDADITGPSIPTAFGVHEKATGDDTGIDPALSAGGVKLMSLNLLTANETDPVVWRGPVIAGAVKQFYSEVLWDDVEYMYVDMPPGTGDVPLTVFQSLPIEGIIIVTTPQELVGMIVEKAVKMARLMNVPVLGIVENMSYFQCPDCGGQHQIYGPSRVQEKAQQYGIPYMAKIPVDPAITAAVDNGMVETIHAPFLDDLLNGLLNK